MPLLEVRNLKKAFSLAGREAEVLRGVDLDLREGERLVLLGPSGCGKSTLLHLIAGLDRPDAGSIRFGGRELFELDASNLARIRRRELGIVFQFFNLFSSLRLLDNVLLPGVLDGRPAKSLRLRAESLLERTGLAARTGARCNELSGGELQRAALCRALLLQPRLLLADEPTGNLDAANRGEIYRLLAELSAAAGAAVLLVTHDEAAASAADRCLRMRDGRVEPG